MIRTPLRYLAPIALAALIGIPFALRSLPSLAAPSSFVLAANTGDGFTYQGRLLNAAGQAVANGSYAITLNLYEVANGGSVLATHNETVAVSNGLFTVVPLNFAVHFDGRDRYIGIAIGSDPELTPRQRITAVPYAFSLRPGAVVNGETSPAAVLRVRNISNDPQAGPAIVGHGSSTITSTGVTGINFTGAALRAEGDGIIQSTASSYAFFTGSELLFDLNATTLQLHRLQSGAAYLTRTDGAQSQIAFLPLASLSRLYGQNVKVASIVVYYTATAGVTDGYISGTRVYRLLPGTGSPVTNQLYSDTTNRPDTTSTAFYTINLNPDFEQTSTTPLGSIAFDVFLQTNSSVLYIHGVRVQLLHQ